MFEELHQKYKLPHTFLYATLVAGHYGLLGEEEAVVKSTAEKLRNPEHKLALILYNLVRKYYKSLGSRGLEKVVDLEKRIRQLLNSGINPLDVEKIVHDKFGVWANLPSILIFSKDPQIRELLEKNKEVRIPILTEETLQKIADILSHKTVNEDEVVNLTGASFIAAVLTYALVHIFTEDMEEGSTKKLARLGVPLGMFGLLVGLNKDRFTYPEAVKLSTGFPHDLYAIDKNPILRRKYLPNLGEKERSLLKKLPEPPLVKIEIKKNKPS